MLILSCPVNSQIHFGKNGGIVHQLTYFRISIVWNVEFERYIQILFQVAFIQCSADPLASGNARYSY